MSQHDHVLDDANGAAFRADLNSVLQAIVTCNSGATAPATTYPNMLWFDTSTSTLKQRNNADTAWTELALNAVDTDGALAANSDTLIASQKATKTYGDTKISKTTAAEIFGMTEKASPVSADLVVIEDSAASNAKKKAQVGNLSADKLSKTTAGEIAAMTEKTTPHDDDLLLLEDSESSNAKKKVKVSNLASGGAWEIIETGTIDIQSNTSHDFDTDFEMGRKYKIVIEGQATCQSGAVSADIFLRQGTSQINGQEVSLITLSGQTPDPSVTQNSIMGRYHGFEATDTYGEGKSFEIDIHNVQDTSTKLRKFIRVACFGMFKKVSSSDITAGAYMEMMHSGTNNSHSSYNLNILLQNWSPTIYFDGTYQVLRLKTE